jgi:hypothetical protein
MKLSVAANYDLDLVSRLATLPVVEVYGKFPADVVGGGRPSYMGTPLTKRDLAELILPYGFKQTPKKQGMLFSMPENPLRIDSSRIPSDFLNGFEQRRCSLAPIRGMSRSSRQMLSAISRPAHSTTRSDRCSSITSQKTRSARSSHACAASCEKHC